MAIVVIVIVECCSNTVCAHAAQWNLFVACCEKGPLCSLSLWRCLWQRWWAALGHNSVRVSLNHGGPCLSYRICCIRLLVLCKLSLVVLVWHVLSGRVTLRSSLSLSNGRQALSAAFASVSRTLQCTVEKVSVARFICHLESTENSTLIVCAVPLACCCSIAHVSHPKQVSWSHHWLGQAHFHAAAVPKPKCSESWTIRLGVVEETVTVPLEGIRPLALACHRVAVALQPIPMFWQERGSCVVLNSPLP